MEKIRIGVIGTGSIAREHLKAYQKNPHVEIYALCDINPEILAKRSARSLHHRCAECGQACAV